MNLWLASLASVILVSLISLIGVLSLSWRQERVRRAAIYLVSLAVGGLLGDSFIHLLPAAFADGEERLLPSLYVMGGILLFFVLERLLRGDGRHIKPAARMNLLGDGLHNFIDGILIGASYAASPTLGVTTTIAVVLHEIPQELGDFGVLVHGGYSVRRAVMLNFLSALTAVAGTVLALAVGLGTLAFEQVLVPVTAGGFLYIAAADLIPELHAHARSPRRFLGALGLIVVGIAVMAGLRVLGG